MLKVATSPTLGGRPDRYTAVGRILPRKTPMSPEGGGYGVVLLRRTTDRNPQACEVMRRSLAFEIAEVDRRADLIDGFNVYRRPIYWPTTLEADGRREWDCKAMLSSYDYERAWLRFSGLPRLSRSGPYIVIVRDTGSQAAIFDFSGIPVDEFDEQFEIVLSYMSRDASIWRGTYYQGASFRQRMRRLLSEDSAATTLVIASLIGLPQPARAATTNE